jgi:hypothetical protein
LLFHRLPSFYSLTTTSGENAMALSRLDKAADRE